MNNRSSHQRYSVKKDFLEISQNSQENYGTGFSCEFCEITKNTFFTEHLWTTASGTRIDSSLEGQRIKLLANLGFLIPFACKRYNKFLIGNINR